MKTKPLVFILFSIFVLIGSAEAKESNLDSIIESGSYGALEELILQNESSIHTGKAKNEIKKFKKYSINDSIHYFYKYPQELSKDSFETFCEFKGRAGKLTFNVPNRHLIELLVEDFIVTKKSSSVLKTVNKQSIDFANVTYQDAVAWVEIVKENSANTIEELRRSGTYSFFITPNEKDDYFKILKGGIMYGRYIIPFPAPLNYFYNEKTKEFYLPDQIRLFGIKPMISFNGKSLLLSGYSVKASDNYIYILPIKNSTTLLIGTLRFPNDTWTPIKKGTEIKGGGLVFNYDGIYFLPGTEIAEYKIDS